MTTNELSKDELSNQELANVSGGVWAHQDEAPEETITFVYGKLSVSYFAQ